MIKTYSKSTKWRHNESKMKKYGRQIVRDKRKSYGKKDKEIRLGHIIKIDIEDK